jgi:hypothetical protein
MILLELSITFILLKYIQNYICLHRETKIQFVNLVLQFRSYLLWLCSVYVILLQYRHNTTV